MKLTIVGLAAGLSLGWCTVGLAQESAKAGAPGVNPKDNITKFEVLTKYDSFKDGVSISSLTLK